MVAESDAELVELWIHRVASAICTIICMFILKIEYEKHKAKKNN